MENIIRAAVERGATDIHIKAGDVFRARIDGEIQPLTKQRLSPDQTRAIAETLISNEDDRERLDSISDYDCSWGAPGIGRFRVNILRQRSSFMIVMRVIPFEIQSLEKLGLPEVLGDIVAAEEGLVLVTGVGASGKSSTVAALVHHINANHSRHVVKLDRPIEFLHRDVNSSITQREVGTDSPDWITALRASLKQDPDVVVMDQNLDPATLDLGLEIAENGHLVIATMHSPDVIATLSRCVSLFSQEERDIARMRLADSLQAVVSQRFINTGEPGRRVVACEILRVTDNVREAIRDRTRIGELTAFMADNRESLGTGTFAQHLRDLVEEGRISEDAAREHS